jgi:hypothetical protein
MSKIEVDAITQQSGTTLTVGGGACKTATVDATTVTLGRSGGTVSLAAGATQSGFGRSGSVNWQTTPKTTTFTAADGEGYFVNTTSGAVTVNLPAGSSGAIVAVNDYANTAASNNITIDSNGAEKIQGSTLNHLITTNGVTVTLVYVDSTQGWKLVDTGEVSSFPQVSLFTVATVSGSGNTLTTAPDCANYKIATFTGPGTFCVSQVGNSPANPSGGPANASFLVVAGGGGGDNGGGAYGGGGGGAGGFRTDHPSTAGTIPLSVSAIPIQVGGGGGHGVRGTPSIFSTIVSTGGGGAGSPCCSSPGGSGAGAGVTKPNGTGNTPPTTPSQGSNGGTPAGTAGAGGGGAGGIGAPPAPSQRGGPGGNGTANTITGSSVTRAGGGGGGTSTWSCTSAPKDGGTGGPGGGGDGGNAVNSNPAPATINGVAGTVNTGGGGGGGAWCSGGPGGPSPLNQAGTAANGGSGIVVIRYKFQ